MCAFGVGEGTFAQGVASGFRNARLRVIVLCNCAGCGYDFVVPVGFAWPRVFQPQRGDMR